MNRYWLESSMLAYCCASLAHFAHNGVFVDQYPNLPDSITVPVIVWTWLGIATIGMTGYLLLRSGSRLIGLGLIALYAAFGFDGFAHYSLAAMQAHTVAMNLTIWGEAIAAAVLLVVVGLRLRQAMQAEVAE